MRLFTPLEKELLNRINSGHGPNLYSLIDPWIEGVSFQVNIQTNTVLFIFQGNPNIHLVQRVQEIQNLVIQAVNLIKLFEDKGYIFTYVNANQLPNPFTFGQAAVNLPSVPYQFPDKRVSELFTQYSTKEIFLTPELNKFITDGFITREEGRANRQYKVTKTALIVSIVALFANLGFNILNKLTTDNSNKITDSKVYFIEETHGKIQHNNSFCRCEIKNITKNKDTIK